MLGKQLRIGSFYVASLRLKVYFQLRFLFLVHHSKDTFLSD